MHAEFFAARGMKSLVTWVDRLRAFFALESNIVILVVSSLVGTTGYMLWQPFLSLYVRSLGATMEQLGFLFSIQLIISMFMGVVSGFLADSIGRKRCIVLGNTIGATNFIIMGLVRNWLDLVPLLLVNSVAGALIGPGMWAMIAESIPKEKRATAFATANVIPSFAFALGPAIGGYVSMFYGYRILYFAGAILQYIMIAIRVKYLRETLVRQGPVSKHPSRTAIKKAVQDLYSVYSASAFLKGWLAVTCINSFSGNIATNYYSLFLEDVVRLNRFEIGSFVSLSQLASIVVTFPAGKLADKIGRRPCILFGWSITIPFSILFLFTQGFLQATYISVISSVFRGLMGPAWSALAAEMTPKEKRATVSGTLNTLGSACGIPAPAIGAHLWENYSIRSPFYASITLDLLAVTIFALFMKQQAKT